MGRKISEADYKVGQGVGVYHLPDGLCLKVIPEAEGRNEVAAYRRISKYPCVRTPLLLDSTINDGMHYMLTTWIDGPLVADVWSELTMHDKQRIIQDLRCQIGGMRTATHSPASSRPITNVDGGPFEDNRVPWARSPRIYANHRAFARAIWPSLDSPRNAATLKPAHAID